VTGVWNNERLDGRCDRGHALCRLRSPTEPFVLDRSRLAHSEICPDEFSGTTVGFLERALDIFQGVGMTARRVTTDNGPNCKSHLFCDHQADRAIPVKKTRSYRPQTNGRPRHSTHS
jgi:hypothetical protein